MKRGLGHIEVILSSVIFLTAIGFAIYFISPAENTRIDASLPHTMRKIIENTSTEVITFGVKINNTDMQINNYPDYSGILAVELNVTSKMKPNVQDYSGKILRSKRVGNITYLEWNKNDENDFVYIRFSEDLGEGELTGTPPVNYDYFTISSSSMNVIVSETRIIELKEKYESDYKSLRNELSPGGDFAFNIVFSDNIITAEKSIPNGVEVFSNTKRIEVLRENGKIDFADLIISTW